MRGSSPRNEDGNGLKFGIEGGSETLMGFTETKKQRLRLEKSTGVEERDLEEEESKNRLAMETWSWRFK